LRERLWVAEIVEGNERRVAMVTSALEFANAPPATDKVILQKQQIWHSLWVSDVDPFRGYQADDSVFAAMVTDNGELVLMEPSSIKIARQGFGGYSFHGANVFELPQRQLKARDPRGSFSFQPMVRISKHSLRELNATEPSPHRQTLPTSK